MGTNNELLMIYVEELRRVTFLDHILKSFNANHKKR